MKRLIFGLYAAAIAILAITTACTPNKELSKNSEAEFKPVVTLQELMVSVIDPNIDPIWNSVTSISTKEGIVEKKPQTDEEWLNLRHHALTLIEVSNLLVIEGRPIAHPGASTSTHPVELSPEEIQKGIDANRAGFVKNAHNLQKAAQLALTAIEAKDAEELTRVGGVIEQACEQCHMQFWYPNDKRPTAVLDLGLKSGGDLYLKMRKST